MKLSIHDYMKKVSLDTDSFTRNLVDSLKGTDMHSYADHLIGLRNTDSVPKARNTLAALIYDAFSGNDYRNIAPILSFLELSTCATYVLDDLMDNQSNRQGVESTFKKFGTNKAMIAAGLQTFLGYEALNMLFVNDLKKMQLYEIANQTFLGYEALNMLFVNDLKKLQLYEIANDMWLKLWIGQGFNEGMRQSTSLDEYLTRCYNICGVMYSAAAKMAAVAAGLEDSLPGQIGRSYGIAVMIRNDLADLLPDFHHHSKALSKKPYEDLRKGICTYPLLHTIQRCDDSERHLIDNHLGTDDVKPILSIIQKYGSYEATLDLITEHRLSTISEIEKLPDSQAKEHLIDLANMLENMRGYRISY